MVDAVICDWNGTISSKTYDNKFFEDLALKSILKFPATLLNIHISGML